MIELQQVTKKFEECGSFLVLKNISFKVHVGEFVCILGPSGCGKSVLLSLIAGFVSPTSGTVTMHGKKVDRPSTDRIMLFQQSRLFPWKTVLENVMFGLHNSGATQKEKKELAKEQLSLVGLGEFAQWYPHKLSGGMQQRVALARALIANPEVLLMDEPFAALDAQYRRYLQDMLLKIWQKTHKTILFVTHSINEAIRMADTIYLFSSRPAQIKQVYQVSLPRPRHLQDRPYQEIQQKIETELKTEFEQIVNIPEISSFDISPTHNC